MRNLHSRICPDGSTSSGLQCRISWSWSALCHLQHCLLRIVSLSFHLYILSSACAWLLHVYLPVGDASMVWPRLPVSDLPNHCRFSIKGSSCTLELTWEISGTSWTSRWCRAPSPPSTTPWRKLKLSSWAAWRVRRPEDTETWEGTFGFGEIRQILWCDGQSCQTEHISKLQLFTNII